MNKAMLLLYIITALFLSNANAQDDASDAKTICAQQASEQDPENYQQAYNDCIAQYDVSDNTEAASYDNPDSIDDQQYDDADTVDPVDPYEAAHTACDQKASNQTDVDYSEVYTSCMEKRGF